MSNLATFVMADDASVDVVNRSLEAYSDAINSLTVALVAGDDDEVTHETPPLRWVMQHMGAQDYNVLAWAGLIAGTVPATSEHGTPIAWGAGTLPVSGLPIPSEAEVIAAWGGGKVRLISRAAFADDDDPRPRGERPPTPLEWRTETFVQENVQVRPYDPSEV